MDGQTPIVVLVTLQRACANLIRMGTDIALMQNRPLIVLHVAQANDNGDNALNAQVLDYLYALSGESGAEMQVISSDVPVTAMANFAKERGAQDILMGKGELARGIAETLSRLLPGVRVQILEADNPPL